MNMVRHNNIFFYIYIWHKKHIRTSSPSLRSKYKIQRDDFSSGIGPVEDNIYNPFEIPFEWQYIDEDLGSNFSRLGGSRIL